MTLKENNFYSYTHPVSGNWYVGRLVIYGTGLKRKTCIRMNRLRKSLSGREEMEGYLEIGAEEELIKPFWLQQEKYRMLNGEIVQVKDILQVVSKQGEPYREYEVVYEELGFDARINGKLFEETAEYPLSHKVIVTSIGYFSPSEFSGKWGMTFKGKNVSSSMFKVLSIPSPF